MSFAFPRILFLLSLLSLILPNIALQAEEWVVLPSQIQPHNAPSRQVSTSGKFYAYPQVITGDLLPLGSIGKQSGRLQWVKISENGREGYLPLPLVVKKQKFMRGQNLPIGQEVVDKDHPLPLDYTPSDLVEVNKKWSYQAGGKFQLRAEAARMAEKMLEKAQHDGINLRIVSAFRSATSQRYNYLRKIAASEIDQQIVAKPGHSEHQLGTVIDLSSLDPKTSLQPSFSNTPEGEWLQNNSRRFGFVQSYTEKNSEEKGYIPEPWHFRYVGRATSSEK